MDFDNSHDHEWQNVILSCLLGIGVYLSKNLHFSFSAFLSSIMDIHFESAAKYIDAAFHYGLLIVTFCFTTIKFYDYMKHRNKANENTDKEL